MKRKVLIAFLAVALAAAFASPLLAGKRKHPDKLKYPQLEIKTPEVTELSFESGLEGFLIEDHEIPMVDLVMLVKTYFPEREKYGINEAARWVIRNGGSVGWPADTLNDELEYLPASIEILGGDLSTLIAVNCLKKDFPEVLGIMADLVMNPLLPDDKVEKKKKDMLEEIRRKNDEPRAIVNREFAKVLYGEHPYAWETTKESVGAITRDDLVEFHSRYFHPNNAIIGISGDVTKAEVEREIGEVFAGWKSAEVDIPEVPAVAEGPGNDYYYAYKDINQAYMAIGHLGINSNNPDRCAVNIMNFILGGGSFTSRITEEVREKRGLAYSAGSRYGSDPFAVGVFRAFAQTKADEYSRAMKIIIEQIEKIRVDGPTEQELASAVDSYLNSQVFDYDSKSGMVRRLVNLKFQGRPLDTPERDMEIYARLTVNDILDAARKYLHPDRLTVFVVGDMQQFDRPLSDFGKVTEIELKEQ